jgi:hypothetical protein
VNILFTNNMISFLIVDVWSSDIWSRIGGNTSRRDQSHVNTRHEILDWFGPSHGVIALRPVLMYYAVEIDSHLLLGSFSVFLRMLMIIFDVDLFSLFIVGEPSHIV